MPKPNLPDSVWEHLPEQAAKHFPVDHFSPNIVRDNPAANGEDLNGTPGPDVFVFDASAILDRGMRDFLINFDPLLDTVAIVNFPADQTLVTYNEDNFIGDPQLLDANIQFFSPNSQVGTYLHIITIADVPIQGVHVETYSNDPFFVI